MATRQNSTRSPAWFDAITKRKPPKVAGGRLVTAEGSQPQNKIDCAKRSALEVSFLVQIEAAGLPAPEEEQQLIEGRKFRYDFIWRDKRIAFEVNGGTWSKGGHSTGVGISRDYEKAALATLAGWRVFSVSGNMVKDGTAINWLRLAMEG